jgi:hypothetical protein
VGRMDSIMIVFFEKVYRDDQVDDYSKKRNSRSGHHSRIRKSVYVSSVHSPPEPRLPTSPRELYPFIPSRVFQHTHAMKVQNFLRKK